MAATYMPPNSESHDFKLVGGYRFVSASRGTMLVPTGEERYAKRGEWVTYLGSKVAFVATFDHGTPGAPETQPAIILEEKPIPVLPVDYVRPVIPSNTLGILIGNARLAAERSVNPLFRKAYENLEAAASHCHLLQQEDRRRHE
jgi:hypothetical protein